MIPIWGAITAWQTQIEPLYPQLFTWRTAAPPSPVFGLYGIATDQEISFFDTPIIEKESTHLPALTLHTTSSRSQIMAILQVVAHLQKNHHHHVQSQRHVERLQALWKKTWRRYRTQTASMKARLRLDPLTHVLNRDGISEQLTQGIKTAKKISAPMTWIALDLDWFKRINDTYGHAVGDAVLLHVATIMVETVRRTDIVGRIGGEEFCAILPGCNRIAGTLVAEKLRVAIGSWQLCVAKDTPALFPLVWATVGERVKPLLGGLPNPDQAFTHVSLSVSAGVSTYPDDFQKNTAALRLMQVMGETTESDILQYMADKALYKAKQLGRNRTCTYHTL